MYLKLLKVTTRYGKRALLGIKIMRFLSNEKNLLKFFKIMYNKLKHRINFTNLMMK